MKLLAITLLFPFLLSPALSLDKTGDVPNALKAGKPIPDSYIITFKDVISAAAITSHLEWVKEAVSSSTARVAEGRKPGVVHSFDIGSFRAYSGVFPADVIEQIKKRPDVASVDQDQFVTTTAPTAITSANDESKRSANSDSVLEKRGICVNQKLNQPEVFGEWGLGRISHYFKFSASGLGWPYYPYDSKNVYCSIKSPGGVAYVIDSGILVTHPEFGGRAVFGYNANPANWPSTDVCGHGTHVAGIIGGKTYGVQKAAGLIAVKVLEGSNGSCGGSWSQVIAGIEWSYKHALTYGWIKTSVINMSLGGYFYAPANNALTAVIAGGLTAVVSAGNSYGADACQFSPASTPDAITVGSSNILDQISPFSNLGCCIDIFAPGQNITSAWLGNKYTTLSGTSMAAPFVAGVVLYNKCRIGYTKPILDYQGITNTTFSINGQLQPYNGCTGGNKLVFNRNNCFPG